jgi:hypothetical protein
MRLLLDSPTRHGVTVLSGDDPITVTVEELLTVEPHYQVRLASGTNVSATPYWLTPAEARTLAAALLTQAEAAQAALLDA